MEPSCLPMLNKYALESRSLVTFEPLEALAKGWKDIHGHLFLASSLSDRASTQRVNI